MSMKDLVTPMTPSGGAFLAAFGAGLIAFVLTPAELRTYVLIGFVAFALVALVMVGAVARTRIGAPTARQRWLVWPPVIVEAGVFWLLFRYSNFDVRTGWIAANAIVAVHFLPMVWSFGPVIDVLGASCLAWAMAAWLYEPIPLPLVVAADGALKLVFGLVMLAAPFLIHHKSQVAGHGH